MAAWALHDEFAVRSAGFAFDMLAPLRLRSAASHAAVLAAHDVRVGEQRQRLLRSEFPEAVRCASGNRERLRQLSRARRAVGRELPSQGSLAEWDTLLSEREQQRAATVAAWTRDIEAARRALHACAGEPRVRHALLWMSPSMHDATRAYGDRAFEPKPSGATARLERRLARYLQRLCTKNETNAFFGPIDYGRLRLDGPPAFTIVRAPAATRCRTFASPRVGQALAAAIEAEESLRPHLRPRRGTMHRRAGAGLVSAVSGAPAPVSELDLTLWELSDGTRDVRTLARALGEDEDAAWRRIARLARMRVLSCTVRVDQQSEDPLAGLLEWLAAADGPAARAWTGAVVDLSDRIAALADAEPGELGDRLQRVERRVEALTGSPARRGHGQMYADRGVAFAECRGELERFELGGAPAARLAASTGPALDLWATAGVLRHRAAQARAAALLRELAPDGSAVPLPAFLAAVRRRGPHPSSGEPDSLAPLRAAVERLISGRTDGTVTRLSRSDLEPLLVAAELPVLSSVDVMLAAPSAEALAAGLGTIVLGEGHAPPLLSVFPTAFFRRDERGGDDAWSESLQQLLAGAGIRVASVAIARDTKIFPYPVGGPTVELRPHGLTCGAIAAAELTVRSTPGGAELADRDGPLLLYPQLHRAPGFDPLEAFTLPAVESFAVGSGPHVPRIELDGVVYQRARWTLEEPPPAARVRGAELFVEMWRWRTRLGLPERGFYRVPGERKPMFVDFAVQPLLEDFAAALAGGCGPVVLTEMLPGAGELWLERAGRCHTCELRMLALRAPR